MPPEGYTWNDFIDVPETMDDMRASYESALWRNCDDGRFTAEDFAEDEDEDAAEWERELVRLWEEGF